MSDTAPRPNRALLVKLAALAAAGLVVAVLVLRGLDVKSLIASGLELLRGAGPVAYFTAMAVLPSVGVPALTFLLSAVPVFGPQIGTTNAVLLALAAMTVNFCLSYAVARRGLRPILSALLTRLGYKLPEVAAADATDLIVMLRVTPGVPYAVQNYLAGLAEMPFGRYFVVSAAIVWPLNTAFLLFGDALLQGKGKIALLSLCALVALTAGLHLVRKHYERRKKAA